MINSQNAAVAVSENKRDNLEYDVPKRSEGTSDTSNCARHIYNLDVTG